MSGQHPVVTMKCLGTKGRFGNQIFQYAFLKIYSSRYALQAQTPPWIGQYLFGHKDPPIRRDLPRLTSSELPKEKRLFGRKKPPFANVDLYGQFMFNAKSYKRFKPLFRSLFRPTPEIRKRLKPGMSELRKRGKTVVGIHVRRGDFLDYPNHPRNFPAPTDWYVRWLNGLWPTLDKPVLFIASDDPDSVLPDFKRFRPVTTADVMAPFPAQPKYGRLDPSFYPDFYILTQCDRLAISNSTFSFAASLLNRRCTLFVRPHAKQKLVPFRPWESKRRLDILR